MPMESKALLTHRIAFVVMGMLAVVSLGIGVNTALHSSMDYQWSPARVLWGGVNPYQYYLAPLHPDIILTQAPNYGHLLYLLLWPYAQLSWMGAKVAWATTNIALLGGGLWLLARRLENRIQIQNFIAAALLLCIGFSVRNVLANGQQTMLIFVAMVLFYVYREKPLVAGMALAVVLTKYSFGLQVALLAMVVGYYRPVIVAAVISIAAIVLFGLISQSEGTALLTGPLSVARVSTAIGFGDLMSLGRRLGQRDPLASLPIIILSVVLNLAYFATIKYVFRHAARLGARQIALLLAGTIYLSFATIYHLKYDYMLLIFCLFAFILSGAVQQRALIWIAAAHFVLFWTLPRYDSLYTEGVAAIVLVCAMILSFMSLAIYCLHLALAIERSKASAAKLHQS